MDARIPPDFVLAHLSNLHLSERSVGRLSPLASLSSFANKRLKGWLSWRLTGRRIHLGRVLELMMEDIREQRPDHIAVTGDLVNISLPREFENATDWLRRLGPPDKVTVIPGNHDAYVPLPQSEGLGRWQDYMADIDWNRPDGSAIEFFPFVRRVGPLALVGLSTALPMPLFVAAGLLGTSQLAALRSTLAQLRDSVACRVVLMHRPPFGYRARSLLDARKFIEVVREMRADLILHGHTHVASFSQIDGIPVIGVPSASAVRHGHKDAAAYNLYRISRTGEAWKIVVEVRGLSRDEGRFTSHRPFEVTVPARSRSPRARNAVIADMSAIP